MRIDLGVQTKDAVIDDANLLSVSLLYLIFLSNRIYNTSLFNTRMRSICSTIIFENNINMKNVNGICQKVLICY
jgi:hypothetical protein